MKRFFATQAFYALFLAAVFSAEPAIATPILLYGGGGEYNIPTQSIMERRYNGVTRQKYDYSCGSAALATLLQEFYDKDVSEQEVLNAMYAVGDQELIKQKGFSLLDMQSYLKTLGYRGEGYRAPLEKLSKADIPAIVLINQRGYTHFVVVAGVMDDSVLLLDSARGKKVVRRGEFLEQWNGILFIIHDDMKIAGKSFNTKKQWATHLQSRFNVTLNQQDLASTVLNTAYTPGYY